MTQNFPPPPPNATAGEIAVDAAESYLGVPYVWGGASRERGRLLRADDARLGRGRRAAPALLWRPDGGLAPVPINDLEPGDLLFYGPGGSEHVAM